jgi:hypothetical protein
MKKRSQLPSAEVLFGKGAKSPKRQGTKTPKRQVEPAKRERLTLYLSPDLWEELERTRTQLYRQYGLKANRSRIISSLLAKHLEDLEALARILSE